MSPATQLYGINGILDVCCLFSLDSLFLGMKSTRPIQKQVEKARESKWVSNFQKYHHLDDNLSEKKKQESKDSYQNTRRSVSPSTIKRGDRDYPPSISQDENDQREIAHFSRRASNPDLTDTDLLMFGMYRLTSKQEEVYNKFVEMISEFNEFDMVRLCYIFSVLLLYEFSVVLGKHSGRCITRCNEDRYNFR
jgi:hypothetical protein